MFDRSTWQFINTFASWFAALGTFLAVVTSLYLARRDSAIRLVINAGLRKIVLSGQSIARGQDVVSITVTNVGRRGATITGLFWKVGIFRRATFDQVLPANQHSGQAPVKLSDGDEASFRIEITKFEQDVSAIFKNLAAGWFPTVQARSIKVGVYTSAGGPFLTTIERRLQQWFVSETRKHCK